MADYLSKFSGTSPGEVVVRHMLTHTLDNYPLKLPLLVSRLGGLALEDLVTLLNRCADQAPETYDFVLNTSPNHQYFLDTHTTN